MATKIWFFFLLLGHCIAIENLGRSKGDQNSINLIIFFFYHYIVTKVFDQLQLKHFIYWVANETQPTCPPGFFF
jgi:hypothetical protein